VDETAVAQAPAPGLPDRARAFLAAVGVAAVGVSAAASLHGTAILAGSETRALWTFLILVVAASLSQLFAFHTIRNQVFHTTPLFLVAGAMLLPPHLLVLIPLISHIPDWLRKRYAWYIQTFNILNFTLAIMSAWAAARLAHDSLSGNGAAWAAAAGAATATYLILNNAGFALILYLARGHRLRQTLHPQVLAADVSLACLGIALATFWRADEWLVPFALVPIFLLHAALHLPQLQEEARADAKTGLANARHFMESLTEEMTRARRFGRPLSVVAADLDLLRNINNTYGHLAGDAVLTGIADILRLHLRHYDVAARFGGEEFTILLPETTLSEASEIAERIREAIATTPIWAESAHRWVNVTISMGVASFPNHGTDPDGLLHHADLAAYRAKLRGRNRVLRATKKAALTAVAPAPFLTVLAPPGDDPISTPAAAGGVLHDRRPSGREESWAAPRLLSGAIAALGVAAGIAATVLATHHDLRGLLLIAGLVAVGQVFALETDHGAISAGEVAALAGAATFGARAALLLAAAAVVVDVVARRTRWADALLRLGANTLALLLAAALFSLAAGTRVHDFLTLALGPVAGVAAFVVVSAMVLGADARGSWWRAWRERFAWLVPYYGIYGFVAAVTAVAYRAAGLYALAAFAVSLLAIRKTQEAVVAQARRNAQHLRHAAAMIQSQNVSLQRANRLLTETSASTIESLSSIVDMRDVYLAGHSRRVRGLSLAIGRALGLSDADLDVLGRAALFHDIGKLAVPDAIVLKAGPLSKDEWVLMRRHPEEGATIIKRLGFLMEEVPAIRHHHEWIDGTGYPGGLVGEAIPLGARVIHVAEAYDSMRTNRLYQPTRSATDALLELRKLAGTQFCTRCVDALETAIGGGSLRDVAGHDRNVAS
jgi:diguanylate cyclase (GGDEF)-like protein/putative nucleotidyltransferase with HDIG domain